MKLESGPAKADRNWQLVRAILFLAFSAWFFYDGAIGWPRKTHKLAEEKLAIAPFHGQVKYDDLGDLPDESTYNELHKAGPRKRAELHKLLGTPSIPPTDEGGGVVTEYFASRWGYAVARFSHGELERLSWVPWHKSKQDVQLQFIFALLPLPLGLYFLWRLYKAVTLHVVIDDDGMQYGTTRIAFDDMVSLRDYNDKGWIDLYYKVGAQEKKLRLDNEKVKRFDEIVDAICQAKGFENELKAAMADKAEQEAEERAAQVAEDAAAAAEDAADSDET